MLAYWRNTNSSPACSGPSMKSSLFPCTLSNHSNGLSTHASSHCTTSLLKPAVILPSLPPSHGRCLASISQPPRDSSSRALTDRWCARHLNSRNTLLIARLPTPIPLKAYPKYSHVVYSPIYKPWRCNRVAAKHPRDSKGLARWLF